MMTAKGEVQTREEATVFVKQLDLFVKVMLLEETSGVLSLDKLCEDHGYTYHWASGQKTTSHQKCGKNWLQCIELCNICGSWFIGEFFLSYAFLPTSHKVLSEESESRNKHRCAVVVQDLATQWIQSYLCKTKTSEETQKSLMKFLEPTRKPKSFTLTIPWNVPSLVRNYPGIIARQHHTDQKQMGIAERAVRRVRGGHLRCSCSPVWIMNGRRILWNAAAICETFKISCLTGKHLTNDDSANHLKDVIPFGSMVEYHPISAKDLSRLHQLGSKVLPGIFLSYALYAG